MTPTVLIKQIVITEGAVVHFFTVFCARSPLCIMRNGMVASFYSSEGERELAGAL